MKKIFLSILSLIALTPFFAFANYEADVWSYVFHLEYKQGVLAVESEAKYAYDPIPEEYVSSENPSTTDFYGVVFSVKNKELGRFGFNKPTTVVATLGKSIMSIHGPYFANASHVGFYNKAGKHLFDISVKGSSFCNDDNKCNASVGENSLNCPNDCLAILNTPPPAPAPGTPALEPATPPTAPEVKTSPPPETGPLPGTGTVERTETVSPKNLFTPLNIIIFVVSVLFLVLVTVLIRIQKHMD